MKGVISVRLRRDLGKHGSLMPAAYNYLRGLPEVAVFSGQHGLRHPLGIYNISAGTVLEKLRIVLMQLEHMVQMPLDSRGYFGFDPEVLNQATEQLLLALNSHIDDCYLVLKTLHPKSDAPSEIKFAHKWLEKAGNPGLHRFSKETEDYRDRLRAEINVIKHRHARIRHITAYNSLVRIPGYYVEGTESDGSVGPDPELHPGNTAFSYNRTLKYHFAHMYIVGLCLKNAVVRTVREKHGLALDENTAADSAEACQVWGKVARKVAQLPMLFYPDEVAKPTPVVAVEETHGMGVTAVAVEYPSSAKATTLLQYRVFTQLQGDGVTTIYRLPYFGS